MASLMVCTSSVEERCQKFLNCLSLSLVSLRFLLFEQKRQEEVELWMASVEVDGQGASV